MTSKKTISARDAERNIGDELLQAIRDVKSGKYGAKYSVEANDIVTTRLKTGLSQASLPALCASRLAPCSSGSKGAVSPRVQQRLS